MFEEITKEARLRLRLPRIRKFMIIWWRILYFRIKRSGEHRDLTSWRGCRWWMKSAPHLLLHNNANERFRYRSFVTLLYLLPLAVVVVVVVVFVAVALIVAAWPPLRVFANNVCMHSFIQSFHLTIYFPFERIVSDGSAFCSPGSRGALLPHRRRRRTKRNGCWWILAAVAFALALGALLGSCDGSKRCDCDKFIMCMGCFALAACDDGEGDVTWQQTTAGGGGTYRKE